MASDPTKVLDEIEQWVIKGDPVHKTAEDAFRHIDQCKARVMALVAIARAVSEWKRLRETDCIDNDAAVIAQEDAMLTALAKLVEAQP